MTLNGKTVTLANAFWDSADRTVYRWDIVNERLGDVATEAVVQNADGSKTMYMVRLKVAGGRITEVETIKANQGEADRLWGPDNLKEVSPALQLKLREADQDSYYGLIAAAEAYWRAFQTNGTKEYHPAPLLADTRRFENGVQTTPGWSVTACSCRHQMASIQAASWGATSGIAATRSWIPNAGSSCRSCGLV
jgi:hypothetical protein